MNVLVTGPDGVLGSNLLRELLKRNYKVTAMSENGKVSPTIDTLPITKIGGNILSDEDMLRATKDIDVVIHCAASTSMIPSRSEIVKKINIDGVKCIVNACQINKVKRFIHVGTANSFCSGNINNPGTELNSYCASQYGIDYFDSKYEAQCYILDKVKNENFDAVIVNPTFMLGAYDSRPSSGEIIVKIYKREVPGYTLGGKNFVAVTDVAIAIANAITKGRTGECYILGNENLTFKSLFGKIALETGVKAPSYKIPTLLIKLWGKIGSILANTFNFSSSMTLEIAKLATEDHYYSSAKAIKELGLPQTSINIAIKDCFDWFVKNGIVKKR